MFHVKHWSVFEPMRLCCAAGTAVVGLKQAATAVRCNNCQIITNIPRVLYDGPERNYQCRGCLLVKAGHDELKLRINQDECAEDAKVRFWRITHCDHTPVKSADRNTQSTSSETYEDDEEYFDDDHSGESSGDGESEERPTLA